MDRLSAAYGRVLDAMMFVACVLLLAMALLIGADVATRNLGLGGIPESNELCEDILYLLTLLSAPWLLRQSQHIRVDIVLRALPPRVGWLMGWIGDVLGFACSVYFVWYGWEVMAASYLAGSVSIKTLIIPEWWLLAPMPVAFVLVAIEFVFRMQRLGRAEHAPRTDVVTVA
jgi:TRAP-type C4-dicarboxylate transport system permease small subunit